MFKLFLFVYLFIILLPNFLINLNFLDVSIVLISYLVLYKFLNNKFLFFLVTVPLFLIGLSQIIYYFNINSQLINSDILNIVFFNIKFSHLKTYLVENLYLIFFCLVFIIVLIKKYKYYNLNLNFKYLFSVLLLLLSLKFFLIFKGDSYKMKYNVSGLSKESAKWITLNFVKNIYPLNFFRNVRTAYLKNENVKKYKKNTENFTFNFSQLKNYSQEEIIILVIGESARSMSFELKNPNIKTNPLLTKRNNLFYFKNAYTPYTSTTNSIPFALSGVKLNHWKTQKYKEKSIITAMKELGFTAYFIDNQGDYNSLTDFFKYESDYVYSTEENIMSYDENIFPILDKVLLDKSSIKKFIVIHTYGSHYKYSDRYPKSFSFFKPDGNNSYSISNKNQLINAYNNSIIYTDYVLDNIIKKVESKNGSVLYFADHGENLYDTKDKIIFHGYYEPTKYSLNIPFLVWLSDTKVKLDSDKYDILGGNLNKVINTESVFNTIVGLTSTKDSLKYSYNKSLFNKNLISLDSIPYFNGLDKIFYFKLN